MVYKRYGRLMVDRAANMRALISDEKELLAKE